MVYGFIFTQILWISILIPYTCGINLNTCNFDLKLKQALCSEGFHRNLTYGLVFGSENEWLFKDCSISVEQVLPSGLYVNTDELDDLRRVKKLNAITKSRINVEQPAEAASPVRVVVQAGIQDGRAAVWLPVHARYQRAKSGGGTSRNIIDPPRVYISCPDARLSACDKDSIRSASLSLLCNGSAREACGWKEIKYTLMSNALIWDVPIGNTDHYYLAAIGTAGIVALGSLYLLKTLHEYKVNKRKQN